MHRTRLLPVIGLTTALASAPAAAQSLRGGKVVTPVTVTATCDVGSTMDITVGAVRRTNQLTVFTTLLVGGFWDTNLYDANGPLLSGHGSTIPDISGGLFYRSITSISGPIPRGTSTLSFTAERHDPLLDPIDSPVLETCRASLTVTVR